MYNIVFTKRAAKDFATIKRSTLLKKAQEILHILKENPFQPPMEELSGNLKGAYSKRLNRQHRIVYQIYTKENTVKILSMWSHYENL